MPLYLFHGTYINQGIEGLIKDGGTSREENIRSMIEKAGGTCEGVYFGLNTDAYAIAHMPSETASTALTLTWNATCRLDVKTIPLLTAAQMDEATTMRIQDYVPPGETTTSHCLS